MKSIGFILRQILFWLVFFAFNRAVFIVYNQTFLYTEKITTAEVLQAFWHALPVDVATLSYLMGFTLLLIFISTFWPNRLFLSAHKVFVFLMILAFALITAAEIGIYPEWKSKLSAKALLTLRNPSEVYTSISYRLFFNLLGITVLITFLAWVGYKRYVIRNYAPYKIAWTHSVLAFLILGTLTFLGIRGGIDPIPISPSAAYFSTKNFLNHSAVNSGFNLTISLIESKKFNYDNPFKWMPQHEAEEKVRKYLEPQHDTTFSILKQQRPNVVVVLLESWSADLIHSLGGEPGITPQFASLEKGGLLFTDFYATGSRSQQAIASLISGFPATPYTTVTENADKYSQLPSLTKTLNNVGYHTSFFFGGKLTYGNIKAYLYHNEFDMVVEQKDFNSDIPAGRLGIHDEYLFEKHLADMRGVQEPFFSVVFTLSSHSPYDQPMEDVIDWGGNENAFVNSAYYTDRELGKYFEKARKEKWYDNTLFILVADHSHNTYRNWELTSFEYHQIPLLLYGEVLREDLRGTTNPLISCNSDLPKTLLNQLDLPAGEYTWSKDLFNPSEKGYAYFELHYGFGWKNEQVQFVYSWDWDHYYQKIFSEEYTYEEQQELINEGRGYLQALFQSFIDL